MSIPDGGEGNVRPLFRSQVVEHAQAAQYGSVLLSRSINSSLLTLASIVVALVVIGFILLFSTSRKAEGHGVLVPASGLLKLIPSRQGVVREIRVHEGQKVLEGQLLFMISADRDGMQGKSTQSAIAALLRQRREHLKTEMEFADHQWRAKADASVQRSVRLSAEAQALRAQIQLQRRRIGLMEQVHQRFLALSQQNFVSEAQLLNKEQEILDAKSKLADLERSEMALRRDSSEAKAASLDFQWQRQREASLLNRSIAELNESLTLAELEREAWVIAPKHGRITGITAVLGQTVSADTQLAALASENEELIGEMYLPSKTIGFLAPGMPVMVRYRAYPYQKYGQYAAHVIDVSATPIENTSAELPIVKTDPERTYRVRLKLESQAIATNGQNVSLRPGMSFDATILLEQRRLWEWIAEPLYSFSRKGL